MNNFNLIFFVLRKSLPWAKIQARVAWPVVAWWHPDRGDLINNNKNLGKVLFRILRDRFWNRLPWSHIRRINWSENSGGEEVHTCLWSNPLREDCIWWWYQVLRATFSIRSFSLSMSRTRRPNSTWIAVIGWTACAYRILSVVHSESSKYLSLPALPILQ